MVPALEDTCCQRVTSLEGENQLILEGVDVPGTGSTLIELRQGRCTRGSSFEYSEDHIETPFASISMDSAGRIVSWIDKDSGRDIVKTGGVFNAFRIGEDIPEAWDNWDIDSDQRLKMADEKRLLKQRVISDGPLQLRLRSEYQLGTQSSITQDMIFHATTPRVDFDTKVDWKERRQLFKVLFNMNVEADFARHEIQYGHVERSTHWNLPQDRARFEVCAHKWTDLSENDFGVALLNDCKYGVSVTGSDVGLTLIKSSVHPDARADEGIHRFVYSVLPHACAFSVKSVVRPAYELNVAPLVSEVSNHAKPFGSLLEVDADNVIIESVKWAEEGKAFVVRLYEAGKSGTQCALTVNAPVKSVRETNLLEEKGRKSQVKDSQVDFYLKPFEIKTLVFEVQ
jgi:alpha-mannosidase